MNIDTNIQTPVDHQKEWRCISSPAKKTISILNCIVGVCLISYVWYLIYSPHSWARLPKELSPFLNLMIFIVTVAVFYCVFKAIYFVIKYSMVQFTPEHMIIDDKKIEINQLTFIKFIKYNRAYSKNSSRYINGVIFMVGFKPESGMKKDVLILMDFGDFLYSQPLYDYTHRFINVIETWANVRPRPIM